MRGYGHVTTVKNNRTCEPVYLVWTKPNRSRALMTAVPDRSRGSFTFRPEQGRR